MTTDERVPIGDTGWFQVSEEEAARLTALFDKYALNALARRAMRPGTSPPNPLSMGTHGEGGPEGEVPGRAGTSPPNPLSI